MQLLLLADPSEALVRRYAAEGIVFGAAVKNEAVGVYVLFDHGRGTWELKNIAVAATHHRLGIGYQLLTHALRQAQQLGADTLEVGTGDTGAGQIAFYEKAGFRRHRVDKGFFLRNYPEPVMENGLQHKDMIFLSKNLKVTE